MNDFMLESSAGSRLRAVTIEIEKRATPRLDSP
jgi:hypothetical protein